VVILTNEQVIEMQSKLDKMNEIVDAMFAESVNAIKDLDESKRSTEREVERLKNRLKSTEEELAMSQKALVNSVEIIDEKNREIEYLQAAAKSDLSLLHDLHAMKRDYENHRGRFGGAGVGAEIDSILNGDGYAQVTAKEQVMTTKELDTFEDLLGKTLSAVEVNSTMDELVFTLDNGEQYMLYHEQDCCETVSIEDICGDLSYLVGSPILMAEEATNENENPSGVEKDWQDSFTWTFYKLATLKGYVTIRWYGESNGYYSERVDWRKV